MNGTDRHDDCTCCAGLQDRTPAPLFNRPGLRQLAYRAGTYSLFKQSMLAGLSRQDRPTLGGLRTRADGDLSVAIIDAWAVVGDVLTFYIERVAQEHYLPTATERSAVDDLVQLIGYRPLPGVAAETWLAFTLETAPDAAGGFRPVPTPGIPARVPLVAGTKVQSIPGPGELPQTFETVEAIEALGEWNTLQPRRTAPRTPADGDTDAWFAGVGLAIVPGDALLFVADDWNAAAPDGRWAQARVVAVAPDPATGRTRVEWRGPLTNLATTDPPTAVAVFALRQRAALFGYNAPDPKLFSDEVRGHLDDLLDDDDWDFDAITASTLYLDAAYRGVEPGGWIVLDHPDSDPADAIDDAANTLARIASVSEVARSGYALAAKVTRLTVERDNAAIAPFGAANTRRTTIRLDSDPLPLAETPLTTPVFGDTITLAHDLGPLAAPRTIIVRARRAEGRKTPALALPIIADNGAVRNPTVDDRLVVLSIETEVEGAPGQHRWRLRLADGFEGMTTAAPGALVFRPTGKGAEIVAEEARAVAVAAADGAATLSLDPPLAGVYDRATTEIFGNAARATHGETVVREVLGSGDGAKLYQQFTLRKNPLTYRRGDTPGVADSTLAIWVDGVRWREVPTLFGCGPRDRVYITRSTDAGPTVVQFGDGESGARLPTGRDNVVATYRHGTGTGGEVATGQLSLLLSRPLGVRGVTNPTRAAGAVDRQEADDTRENAPRSVMTLGRIVSLRDYEDFARTFAGIAKAQAVWTWDGARRGVLLTVAGVGGEAVSAGEIVHDDLLAAIAAAGSPRVPFRVKSYRADTFRLRASLRPSADRRPEDVLAAVRATLAERFSFDARSFGQLVALSEIYAALHAVPGVVSADIDHLYRGDDARLDPFLIADAPANGTPPGTAAAELLTLDPASLDDLEVRA